MDHNQEHSTAIDDFNAPILRSLKLGGDNDDVDLLQDIERIFDIKITSTEAFGMMTVGDLFDTILRQFPEPTERRSVCLTAAMFYRLRQQLAAMQPMRQLAPSTRLTDLFASVPLRTAWQKLEGAMSLKLPPLRIGWTPVGPLLRLRRRASPPMKSLWTTLLVPAVFVALPSFLLTALFIRQLPSKTETIGDLAHEIVLRHFGYLSREYRSYRIDDLWARLELVLHDHTGISPRKGKFGPQTEFF